MMVNKAMTNIVTRKRLESELDAVKRTAERAYQNGKPCLEASFLIQSDVDSLAVAVVSLTHIVKELLYRLEE